jgi:NAD(P)-dependent dehydrogenase (short-subunit alcohol dehydrogenase family)
MSALKGKIALITAAGSPIGAACAARLADAGCHVILADPDGTATAPIVALIRSHKGSAEYAPLDPTDERNWRAMAGYIRTHFKRLDVLVQTAHEMLIKPFAKTTLSDVRDMARTNIVAPWLGLKYLAPLLREAGGAAVVNVVSSLGRTPHADAALASATAAGVRMMSKSAALEWGPQGYGVTVNTVNVGQAPWLARPGSDPDLPDLGPAITPAEVAEAVHYLCTPDAKYITGMEITLDGGRSVGP